MKASQDLLDSLSKMNETVDIKPAKEDHDLGEVLQFFFGKEPKSHKLRLPDGTEETFTF